MRDINKYVQEHMHGESADFERTQEKYRLRKLIKLLNQCDRRSLLEVGCGLDSLARHVDGWTKYTLIEPSERYLNHAKKMVAGGGNCKFIHGFFEESFDILSGEPYSVIVISGVLHEVEEPKKFLDTAIRLSNPETTIILTVPNANSFHRVLAYESGLIKNVSELSQTNLCYQVHNVYDMEELMTLVNEVAATRNKQAVFLERGSYFVKPFTHKQMTQCLSLGIFDEKILDGLNNMVKYMPDLGSEIYLVFKTH